MSAKLSVADPFVADPFMAASVALAGSNTSPAAAAEEARARDSETEKKRRREIGDLIAGERGRSGAQ